MRPVRSALLWASTNQWLARRLPDWYFTRRAVRRFMPGEELDDAFVAAGQLAASGVPTIITRLGENVGAQAEVDAVVAHYEDAIEQVHASGLDCYISVKPTQLGLDLDRDLCLDAHRRLARAASARGNLLWIDMESSAYTSSTLDLYRALRLDEFRVGLCLQANLRRTSEDLARLLPLAPSIRLVKGAYAEPADRAYARKRDVDEAYVQLAQQLLRTVASEPGVVTGIATHDARVIDTIAASAQSMGRNRSDFELQMLYGIRVPLQQQLARDGFQVRVLISYGEHWFPWYMRRLAERPANVWFVARSMLSA
jgi:proline dehydrogenase